jgi:hypothetical protein
MNAPAKPSEPIDPAALRQSYLDEIDAAPDLAAVRRVQRRMQGDKRVFHAIAHAINEHVRAWKPNTSPATALPPAPATSGAGAELEEAQAGKPAKAKK